MIQSRVEISEALLCITEFIDGKRVYSIVVKSAISLDPSVSTDRAIGICSPSEEKF